MEEHVCRGNRSIAPRSLSILVVELIIGLMSACRAVFSCTLAVPLGGLVDVTLVDVERAAHGKTGPVEQKQVKPVRSLLRMFKRCGVL
jgi:hypothetical protein